MDDGLLTKDPVVPMKAIYYVLLIVLIIAAAGFFMFNGLATNATGNVVADNSAGQVQKVTLSSKNLNYYPNTITVKSDEPVRIYLDESVTGCLRSFTIRDFGVAKYLRTPNDYIEFTPTKQGTYSFACSMGMGTGTLIVE